MAAVNKITLLLGIELAEQSGNTAMGFDFHVKCHLPGPRQEPRQGLPLQILEGLGTAFSHIKNVPVQPQDLQWAEQRTPGSC